MKLSLRRRMFVWFAGLSAVLLLGTSVAHYVHAYEHMFESLDARLRERARFLATQEEDDVVGDEFDTRTRRFRGFERYSLWRPSVLQRSKSLGDAGPLLPPERVASIAAAPDSPPVAQVVDRPGVGLVRVLGGVFPGEDEGMALVVVGEDLGEVHEELMGVLHGFLVTLPVALLLAAAGAWLASRHLTRPLREIAAAAERIESGGAAVAIPGPGAGDEIDALAAALERTFARLRDAYARQARFSADAAHELRTPVAVLLSQAEVALRRDRTAAEHRETLTEVAAAARRMQQTLEALLLVARGDAGRVEIGAATADLADVARDAIAACAPEAAAKSVEVRLDAPQPAVIAGDARLLGILVRNLLANAIAYSGAATPVTVAVASSARDAVLTVRDDGAGIPSEALPHVFEPFFRVDDSRSRATGGSGLGLSLVRLIAELHGGTASVESAPGKGTRVTVRIPVRP